MRIFGGSNLKGYYLPEDLCVYSPRRTSPDKFSTKRSENILPKMSFIL